MNKIYQLKITLNNSDPLIWRRILTKSDILLSDLHKIIQTIMGWTNSHLHQFSIKGKFYSPPLEDEDLWDELEAIDYSSVKLEDLIKEEKEKIVYEYDVGDGWEHTILLEKILPMDKNIHYPKCIDGKRSCPPEDCGGMGGYENLLEIIQDPENEEYEEMMEWLGDEYDPEYFNLNEINELLKKEDFGCIELID